MANDTKYKKNMGSAPPPDDEWWAAILENIETTYPTKRQLRRTDSLSTQVSPQEPHLKTYPQVESAPSSAGGQESQPGAEVLQREIVGAEAEAQAQGTSGSNGQTWAYIAELYERDQSIELMVTGYNRGGILVKLEDTTGFVPISHLVQITHVCTPEDSTEEALQHYVGKVVSLKVIEFDSARERVVLSERAAQAESGRRLQLLDEINVGDCLHGIVTTIAKFGVFVDLGGVEGLIHISELSWGRIQHPKDIVAVGDALRVAILDIDHERSRVALSLKRLQPNPWDGIEQRYQPGQVVDAVITGVVPFGAFARLDLGVDGLIHASELGENGDRPVELLHKGQRVQVSILTIDPEHQRMGLRLQQVY